MNVRRLFCSELYIGSVALADDEAHHARSVLRLKADDEVMLLDGRGGEADARVERIHRREVVVEIRSLRRHAWVPARRVTLGVALPRRHRQGYLVEKCTELGAWGIWIVDAERGVARPDRESAEHCRRRAMEALKQCGRFWLPEIAGPMSLTVALTRRMEFDAVGFLHPAEGANHLNRFLADAPGDVLLLIGPEGGWSKEDVEEATESGAAPVGLGSIVLRTETAAVAACALATLSRDLPERD